MRVVSPTLSLSLLLCVCRTDIRKDTHPNTPTPETQADRTDDNLFVCRQERVGAAAPGVGWCAHSETHFPRTSTYKAEVHLYLRVLLHLRRVLQPVEVVFSNSCGPCVGRRPIHEPLDSVLYMSCRLENSIYRQPYSSIQF